MPQVINIPGVGMVRFPDAMDDKAITSAAYRLHTEAQAETKSAAAETKFSQWESRRDNLAGQMSDARRQGAVTERDLNRSTEDLKSIEALAPTIAATPENPFGLIGSAAKGAGQVVNAVGDVTAGAVRDIRLGETRTFPATAAALSGSDPGPSPGGAIGAGLDEAGRMVPVVVAGTALAAAGVPGPAAFGLPMAGSTFAATDDPALAAQAGITGAAIPGVGNVFRNAAAAGLGKLASAGIIKPGATFTQKAVEALAAQGGIQAFMEGLNIPEYLQMTPEERKETLVRNLVSNSAFLAMDVPGVLSRSPSATQGRTGKGTMAAAKVGEVMESLVNSPEAIEALRIQADGIAEALLEPRRGQPGTLPAGEGYQSGRGPVLPRETALELAPPAIEAPSVDPAMTPVVEQAPAMVKPEPAMTAMDPAMVEPRPAPLTEAPVPAHSGTGQAPETITGSNEGKASVMPAEAGETPAPVQRRKRGQAPVRPFDIIDLIEGEIGKIKTVSASTKANASNYEGWQELRKYGPARKLLSSSGNASTPDQVVDALIRRGKLPEGTSVDELREAILAAAKSRRGDKESKSQEQVVLEAEERQHEAFVKTGLKRSKLPGIPVPDLIVGDEFELAGTKVKVKDFELDEDSGDVIAVILEDGRRFGTQRVSADQVIRPDADSLKRSNPEADWPTPEPAPSPEPEPAPTLKGNQKQGDLLGSGDVDFNLYGGRTADGDRVTADRAKAEETTTAAKEFADKNQMELGSVERATLPRQIEGDFPAPDTSKPVSLASIREYLSKALDIPVRLRGYRRQAVGIFRPKAETIRLKLLNDIPTLAHEVGHYLHWILFPRSGTLSPTDIRASDFAKRFDSELMPLGAVTSRPSYTPHQVRQEGVAEWLRTWLTNPPAAHVAAPGFTSFFEAKVGREFPEVWKIIKQAQGDIRRYIAQPAAAKIRSMISVDQAPPREPLTRKLQRFADNWINDLGPIDRAMGQLREFGLLPKAAKAVTDFAVNYIGGWRGKAQVDLFHRQMDLDGRDVGPSLRTILSGIGDLDGFRTYLVAKRALEKNGQGKRTGIESSDAQQVVRAGAAAFEAKRQQLLAFQRNARDLLLQSGLLSPDQVRAMDQANEDYVPFHRVYESVAGSRGSGEGFINLGQGINAFKGSDRTIIDPLESIVKNVYLFRDLAERNRVGVTFAKAVEGVRGGGRIADSIARRLKPVTVKHTEMVKALEDAGIDVEGLGLDAVDLTFKVWRMARQSKPGDGIFTVWRDGQEHPYQVDDAELYRALSLADSTASRIFSNFPLAPTARLLTRALRAGATLAPEFIARNPFRDQITAGVFSRHGFVPFWDGFRGALSAIGKDQWYWDWVKSGGRYSDFVAMDRTDLQAHLKDVVREPTALRTALELANPLNVLRNLQRFSEFMEQATRISEFRRAKQAGAGDIEAANASKEVTLNFARGGFRGKALNQIAAFFNASVQDWSKFLREHNYATDPKRAMQVQAKALLYITVPSVLAWYLGKDDQEIQNLPAWRKNLFWNINLRPLAQKVGIEADDFVLSFPKPFLLGQLYGSSVERGLDYATERDPNAVRKWINNLIEATPIHPQNLLPTAVRPAVETAANYSFFTGQPIENQGMQSLPPDFRMGPNTSQTSKHLADLLPWEWATPVRLDNLARGYLGSLSRYGTDAIDFAMAKAALTDTPEPAEKTIWERPVLRAFVRSPYEPSDFVRRFFDGYERAEQRITALRKGPQFIESEKMRDWAKKEVPELLFYLAPAGRDATMMTHLRDSRESLGDIIKAMAEVKNSRTLNGAEKADRLRKLSEARDQLAETAFKAFLAPADRMKVY
jgi:hypothetical protein